MKKTKSFLTRTINETLKEISRDYSVQCHFGLIWQKNILSNLKTLSKTNLNIDTSKTAAIIAAGPSLDSTIDRILSDRAKYYIIATDTALSVLSKRKIKIDAAVSIDGQNISYKHFVGNCNQETLFIFDLQANFNAVNYVSTISDKILFVKSGHPLCTLAEKYSTGSFTEITSGAGTVTIAAIDFARKAGFSKIKTFAADFSYFSGKAYAKGTYLDQNFNGNSYRLNSGEQQYDTLMFRTPLILKDIRKKIYTTEVLESYRKTFEQWQSDSSNKAACICEISNPKDFTFGDFFKKLISTQNNANGNFSALLPYIAFLRKDKSFQNKDFSELLKLAQSTLLQYNSWI